MTKVQEYQELSAYLGMTPKAYVDRGLALKRSVERGDIPSRPTEVGGAPLPGGGSVTSSTLR